MCEREREIWKEMSGSDYVSVEIKDQERPCCL